MREKRKKKGMKEEEGKRKITMRRERAGGEMGRAGTEWKGKEGGKGKKVQEE